MAVVTDSGQFTNLLERIRAGDDDARGTVIEHTTERLRALARRMLHTNPLRRWEQTDDLLQQTLVRLDRHLNGSQATSTAAFLSLAALEMRHALIDLVRHYFGPHGLGTHYDTATIRPCDRIATHPEPSDPEPTPSQQALLAERWEQLYRAVGDLPEDKRSVVDLIWFHDLTHAEAAVLLGVSEKTVARRWREARVALFDALSGDLPGA
jgi:RNA polymerase sigma-70 factor (ECF subfamily)